MPSPRKKSQKNKARPPREEDRQEERMRERGRRHDDDRRQREYEDDDLPPEDIPGPANYNIERADNIVYPTAPAYTIGRKPNLKVSFTYPENEEGSSSIDPNVLYNAAMACVSMVLDSNYVYQEDYVKEVYRKAFQKSYKRLRGITGGLVSADDVNEQEDEKPRKKRHDRKTHDSPRRRTGGKKSKRKEKESKIERKEDTFGYRYRDYLFQSPMGYKLWQKEPEDRRGLSTFDMLYNSFCRVLAEGPGSDPESTEDFAFWDRKAARTEKTRAASSHRRPTAEDHGSRPTASASKSKRRSRTLKPDDDVKSTLHKDERNIRREKKEQSKREGPKAEYHDPRYPSSTGFTPGSFTFPTADAENPAEVISEKPYSRYGTAPDYRYRSFEAAEEENPAEASQAAEEENPAEATSEKPYDYFSRYGTAPEPNKPSYRRSSGPETGRPKYEHPFQQNYRDRYRSRVYDQRYRPSDTRRGGHETTFKGRYDDPNYPPCWENRYRKYYRRSTGPETGKPTHDPTFSESYRDPYFARAWNQKYGTPEASEEGNPAEATSEKPYDYFSRYGTAPEPSKPSSPRRRATKAKGGKKDEKRHDSRHRTTRGDKYQSTSSRPSEAKTETGKKKETVKGKPGPSRHPSSQKNKSSSRPSEAKTEAGKKKETVKGKPGRSRHPSSLKNKSAPHRHESKAEKGRKQENPKGSKDSRYSHAGGDRDQQTQDQHTETKGDGGAKKTRGRRHYPDIYEYRHPTPPSCYLPEEQLEEEEEEDEEFDPHYAGTFRYPPSFAYAFQPPYGEEPIPPNKDKYPGGYPHPPRDSQPPQHEKGTGTPKDDPRPHGPQGPYGQGQFGPQGPYGPPPFGPQGPYGQPPFVPQGPYGQPPFVPQGPYGQPPFVPQGPYGQPPFVPQGPYGQPPFVPQGPYGQPPFVPQGPYGQPPFVPQGPYVPPPFGPQGPYVPPPFGPQGPYGPPPHVPRGKYGPPPFGPDGPCGPHFRPFNPDPEGEDSEDPYEPAYYYPDAEGFPLPGYIYYRVIPTEVDSSADDEQQGKVMTSNTYEVTTITIEVPTYTHTGGENKGSKADNLRKGEPRITEVIESDEESVPVEGASRKDTKPSPSVEKPQDEKKDTDSKSSSADSSGKEEPRVTEVAEPDRERIPVEVVKEEEVTEPAEESAPEKVGKEVAEPAEENIPVEVEKEVAEPDEEHISVEVEKEAAEPDDSIPVEVAPQEQTGEQPQDKPSSASLDSVKSASSGSRKSNKSTKDLDPP